MIVGIDPGSTSAVAAVTLDGEIELLESGKNFPPREIIQRIVRVGKPVVVASDRQKTPGKVQKIGTSVGARVFEPDEDLSSERKRELGKGANSHELDAVASAFYAQKQLKPRIRKIERLEDELEIEKKEIARRVFNDLPVSNGSQEEAEGAGKVVENFDVDEETAESSETADRERQRLERKVENLEDQVQELRSELGEKRAREERLEHKIEELKQEDREEVLKEREVVKRDSIIEEKEQEIERLEEKMERFRIRQEKYRKALEKVFSEDYDVVPVVSEGVEKVPVKAVSREERVVEKLEARGSNIFHVEELEGIELGNFMAVESFPQPKNFENIIREYRESR